MPKKLLQTARGVRDVLPEENLYLEHIVKVFSSLALKAGYGKIETPIFEDTSLFVRSVGKNTHIVEKEMYTFRDKSGHSLTLRPEGTAPVVRAYLENGMQSLPKPTGFYYSGSFFRYERPQAGRYRQFTQTGVEVFGSISPLLDASLVAMVMSGLSELKIQDISLQINSIGCPECRPKYKKKLVVYLSDNSKNLCKDCLKRAKTNPLRVLDCKQKGCQAILEEAPQIVNNLCLVCHNHFKEVLEWLDELDIIYEINPKLVRGLDYYSKTVFEIWTKKEQGQNSLGGGGRYDDLVEMLGGRKTAAIGFAMGVDRIIGVMKEQQIEVKNEEKVDIYVAQLGEVAKKKGFRLMYELQKEGIGVKGGLEQGGLSEQLRMASKLKVYITLIIGQKEALSDSVIIKDMQSGNQDTYPLDKVAKEVKRRLKSLKEV